MDDHQSIAKALVQREERHAAERNWRSEALDVALRLASISGRKLVADELISEAEKLLGFLRVPPPPDVEIPDAAGGPEA